MSLCEEIGKIDFSAAVGGHAFLQELGIGFKLRGQQVRHFLHGTGTPVAKALADALLFSERVGHGLSVRRRGHDRRTEAAQRRAPQLLILDPGREGNMRLAGQPATRP